MASKFSKIDNKQEWQVLSKKVLFKTFFHSLAWEEFLEKEFKWLKFERYNWQDKALLSLARVKIFGKEKLISHPFCEYGGPLPLVDKINGEEFKQDLLSEFSAQGGSASGGKDQMKISFHPQLINYLRVAPKAGSHFSGRVSYFVEGFLNLRKTTRHEIEKAKANNLQIEKCQSQKDLRDFYNLYIRSAKKHRIPAYPLSFFDYFAASPASEIILAKNDDRVVAGSVFLFYDKFTHYFQNAVDEKYKNLGANYLILWEQINKSLAKNLVFDFGGTRIGSPLEVFKEGWGGKEYPIFELKNYQEESSLRKSKLRDVFNWLPLFLIKKLSPYLLKYKL